MNSPGLRVADQAVCCACIGAGDQSCCLPLGWRAPGLCGEGPQAAPALPAPPRCARGRRECLGELRCRDGLIGVTPAPLSCQLHHCPRCCEAPRHQGTSPDPVVSPLNASPMPPSAPLSPPAPPGAHFFSPAPHTPVPHHCHWRCSIGKAQRPLQKDSWGCGPYLRHQLALLPALVVPCLWCSVSAVPDLLSPASCSKLHHWPPPSLGLLAVIYGWFSPLHRSH